MAIKAMEWAWGLDLPKGEKWTLMALADAINREHEFAFPSQATIARKTGVTERQVRTHIRALEGRGLVHCVPGAGHGHGKGRAPTRYFLAVDPATGKPKPLPLTGGTRLPPVKPLTGGSRAPVAMLTGGSLKRLQAEVCDTLLIEEPEEEPEKKKATLSRPAEPDSKPKAKTKSTGVAAFDEAWGLWPRRDRSAKKAALTAWKREAKAESAEALLKAVRRYLASAGAKKRDKETGEPFGYVPAMERWLCKQLPSWLEIADAPATRRWSAAANAFVEAA